MGDENACPQAWGGGLAREVRRVAACPPPGLKLLLRDDLADLTVLIDGPPETPYAGGVFRVRVSLARYPTEAPRARFETRIFHPNVSSTGEVCVSTLARDWRPALGLAHALASLRCLLLEPNAESALNEEAAALLRDRPQEYEQRARLYTDIHARPATPSTPADPGPAAEPSAAAMPVPGEPSAKRERRAPVSSMASASRDRRRILKRL